MMKKAFQVSLKSIAFAMLFSSFSTGLVFSQENKDSLRAAELLLSAIELANEKDYAKSTTIALQAVKAFTQLRIWGEVQNSYYRIFLNGHYSQNYETSIALLTEGLEQVPTNQLLLLGKLNMYLGYAHEAVGDLVSSIKAYERSILPLSQIRDSSSLYTTYTNIASGYNQFSDYAKAIVILNNAQALEGAITNTNTIWLNTRILGDAYLYQGDLENAKKVFVKAQKMHDRFDGTFERCYAEIHLRKGELKKASRYAKQSIALAESKGDDPKAAQKILSEIYLAMGKPKLALSLMEDALPNFKKDPNRRRLGRAYFSLGTIHKALKQYDQALRAFQQSFEAFLPTFKATSPDAHPAKKLWTREINLPYIYNSRGDCFYAKYQTTQQEKWLRLAEENYELAIDCVQNVLLNYDETESKLAERDLTHSFYENAIKTKLELFELTRQSKYQAAAFQIAQEANAFVLRELLNEQKSMEAAGVPEETIDLLKNYQRRESLVQRELGEAKNDEVDSLRNVLFELKNKEYQLKQKLEKDYPKFTRLRSDLKVANISALQEKMDDSSLLIKYFQGEEMLYIFAISQNSFTADTIDLPNNFDDLIYQYRRAISDLDFINTEAATAEKQYLHTAHRLYQLLLEKPLRQHNQNQALNRLTIVGDGVLSAIPFQALLVQKSDSWEDPTHLVLSQFALSYSYFCKLLLEPTEAKNNANTFVSFGIEFDEYTLKYLQEISKDEIKNKSIKAHLRSGNFSALPFSDDEAKEVAELMEGQSWLNKEATKSNFLQSIPQADIIHMATHSILDVEQPEQSALVFIKTRDSLDNLLRLSEIYNLEMTAEMLVLSACNTGFGPIARGEGINSLARAFNISGVPSVVATLWGITDESSKKIMKLYYEFLKTGLPKDIALQRAQLEFLHNDKISSPSFRLPVFWAAWVPIGAQNGISMDSEQGIGLYLLLAVFALFVLAFFFRK